MPEIEVNAKVGKNPRKYKDLHQETRGFSELAAALGPAGKQLVTSASAIASAPSDNRPLSSPPGRRPAPAWSGRPVLKASGVPDEIDVPFRRRACGRACRLRGFFRRRAAPAHRA